jgi:integrase
MMKPFSSQEDKWEAYLSKLVPKTRKTYRHDVNLFFEVFGTEKQDFLLSIDEIMDDAEKPLRIKLSDVNARLQQIWDRYVQKIQDRRIREGEGPYSKGTLAKHANSMNCWFTSQGYPSDVGFKVKQGVSNGADCVTKELAELMFENSETLRQKALIMTLKDTGLRRGDIARLNLEDVLNRKNIKRDEADREFCFYDLKDGSEKKNVRAIVCLGPDALKWIMAYAGNRREGPLFLTEREGVAGLDTREKGSRISPESITNSIVCCRGKIKALDNASPHSFRKMWLTNMTAKYVGLESMSIEMAKLCTGKKIGGSMDEYLFYRNAIPETYMRLYPRALELGHDPKQATLSEELRKAQHEIEALKLESNVLDDSRTLLMVEALARQLGMSEEEVKEFKNGFKEQQRRLKNGKWVQIVKEATKNGKEGYEITKAGEYFFKHADRVEEEP